MKWYSLSLSLGALICGLPAAYRPPPPLKPARVLASSLCCLEGPEEPGPLAVPGPPLGVSDLETALMD